MSGTQPVAAAPVGSLLQETGGLINTITLTFGSPILKELSHLGVDYAT